MAKSKLRLQGLILDVDGTLVDSNEAHVNSWQDAFQAVGKGVPSDELRSQIGKGGDLLVPEFLNAREMRALSADLLSAKKTIYMEKYRPLVRPFPGVTESMRQLHERGVKMVLASSADEDEVEFYKELLGIGTLIEDRTSKADAKYSKPSPEIFQAAFASLGTPIERTLVVGDTPYDIRAAHRARLAVAALLCGGFLRSDLAKAELLFDDLRSLVSGIELVENYLNS